eukprot:12025370-Alexandrium_andersonii.AAC.1
MSILQTLNYEAVPGTEQSSSQRLKRRCMFRKGARACWLSLGSRVPIAETTWSMHHSCGINNARHG